MKIYTKKGDQGHTSLIGARVSKDHIQIEACGTVDECNAQLGEAITHCQKETFLHPVAQILEQLQHQLFDLGADLAQAGKQKQFTVHERMIQRLEVWIDQFEDELTPLRAFILPGGTPAASSLHLARVLARRAERRVVTLLHQEEGNPEVRRYLNRLSDLLFVLARVANARSKVEDVEYRRG
ncbi:cob(I)alamin adenosyltransferase [Seinonella peptonophila]|uniref:Corrinoid adenosyltransferase n=1 Tax=Seinonella peptonophila TaxID=112248 RepID=A0A1M5AID8_9BACL|nr:cob(I)yrinic acid a,c-diamide adenosyltransferase [Seinonella peptonophila]SHF30031.1 cob(I)alamin adenosyltransferase [Seinonella peptonophila]